MADILEEIIAWKRIEIEQAKRQMPERALHAQVERIMAEDQPVASLKEALNTQGADKRRPPQIIAEFKRKSPSKGWIHQDAMAETVTIDYQLHGAAAVSILTDQKYFGGSDEFILNARRAGLTLPVLYKNFVVDEYQLFQAKACGASAVLLIAADLSKTVCRRLLEMSHQLKLEVLLEMHTEGETEYADLQPDVCGINNRNLGTFVTDITNSVRLASLLLKDIVKVSESGIHTAEDMVMLWQQGFDGFLIGERFMKEQQPGEALKAFLDQAYGMV